ncbi:beta-galactosidase [Paenibacillus sp. BIHB 4019]|uniref:Beta-galactosidase n=1 Tax=Paenibacillus sp. BIHB 4019 TaxID=1870819 RepID=A0A1B2DQZ3_9BACL|nr:beta-galactosidase [Paenibacillus sp. BIHB 4019]ANY70118.1 beta-galactosidase [Paenibacillus sp. BIHB 4019]
MSKHHIAVKLNERNKEIRTGTLSGNKGSNPKGESFGFTNFYMTRNGEPFIPVVGEFHFSRFSYLYWEEELLKMKAGGVHVIATYIFWNYHEEKEGRFNWNGSRNLRHFIDLCAKLELPLVLRIGPFCHGEVRNGGIPDWVFDKPLVIRSNDELYLKYAARLYREIARQMKGSLFQEGGPVIAIQLENEFMHCGAPLDSWGYKTGIFMSSGTGGNAHLDKLKAIAAEAGIRPLFFTATAWGGAAVPETDTLPMLAGYAYTPWIPNQPPSGEYIFRDLHVTPMEKVNYPSAHYPVAYCEMAGGMQVSYTARPHVSPDSVEAMTLVKLASGSNLLGYYMYHGGSNPRGENGFLNEYGLPKITYDYQSPLGEFGRIGESYDRIRTLSLFMEAYGAILAPMGTVLPEGQAELLPENTEALRYCLRQKDGSGFLFLNNFQDHVDMPDREEVSVTLGTSKGQARFPHAGSLRLKQGISAVLPFHLEAAGIRIVSATVQPLTKLADLEEPLLVFYAHEGMSPELVIAEDTVAGITSDGGGAVEQQDGVYIVRPPVGKQHVAEVKRKDGNVVRILVLSREEALNTYRLRVWGEERLLISDSHLYAAGGRLICTSPGKAEWQVAMYPAAEAELKSSQGSLSPAAGGLLQTYTVKVADYEPQLLIKKTSSRHAAVQIDAFWPEQVADLFLHIEYDGDVAAAYLNNELLTDHIHYGQAWPIGLKGFQNVLMDNELQLAITPIRKGTTHTFVNQAFVERFEGVEIAAFHEIKAVPHYVTALSQVFK